MVCWALSAGRQLGRRAANKTPAYTLTPALEFVFLLTDRVCYQRGSAKWKNAMVAKAELPAEMLAALGEETAAAYHDGAMAILRQEKKQYPAVGELEALLRGDTFKAFVFKVQAVAEEVAAGRLDPDRARAQLWELAGEAARALSTGNRPLQCVLDRYWQWITGGRQRTTGATCFVAWPPAYLTKSLLPCPAGHHAGE